MSPDAGDEFVTRAEFESAIAEMVAQVNLALERTAAALNHAARPAGEHSGIRVCRDGPAG